MRARVLDCARGAESRGGTPGLCVLGRFVAWFAWWLEKLTKEVWDFLGLLDEEVWETWVASDLATLLLRATIVVGNPVARCLGHANAAAARLAVRYGGARRVDAPGDVEEVRRRLARREVREARRREVFCGCARRVVQLDDPWCVADVRRARPRPPVARALPIASARLARARPARGSRGQHGMGICDIPGIRE